MCVGLKHVRSSGRPSIALGFVLVMHDFVVCIFIFYYLLLSVVCILAMQWPGLDSLLVSLSCELVRLKQSVPYRKMCVDPVVLKELEGPFNELEGGEGGIHINCFSTSSRLIYCCCEPEDMQ